MIDSRSEKDDLKVLLIGDAEAGKSKLFLRYVRGEFSEPYVATIGVDATVKNLEQNKFMFIYDVSGKLRYQTIATSYYHSADVYMIVFDVTNSKSFENIKTYLERIKSQGKEKVPIILVGTKTDLEERPVSDVAIQTFADQNNYEYIKTSAKTGANVDEAFQTAITLGLAAKSAIQIEQPQQLEQFEQTNFFQRHWRAMLAGGLVVGGIVAIGVFTGGIGFAVAGIAVATAILAGAEVGALIGIYRDNKEEKNKISGNQKRILSSGDTSAIREKLGVTSESSIPQQTQASTSASTTTETAPKTSTPTTTETETKKLTSKKHK